MEIIVHRDSLSLGLEHELRIEFSLRGRHHRATLLDPSEHPEVEVNAVYLRWGGQEKRIDTPGWIIDEYEEEMREEAEEAYEDAKSAAAEARYDSIKEDGV